MTVEELVRAIEDLSEADLRGLARQVPGLREAAAAEERAQLAEAQAAYQIERTEGATETRVRAALTPEERLKELYPPGKYEVV